MVRAGEVGREMQPTPVDDDARVAGVAWTGEVGTQVGCAPADDDRAIADASRTV